MEKDFYYDDPETVEGRIGQQIYHDALSGRRGFRDDQIGIPTDDDVWLEIFEDIGCVALKAVPHTALER